MSGFLIRISSSAAAERREALRLISLGKSEASGGFEDGAISAAWVYPGDSKHRFIRREPGRLLWVEGEPDRLPRDGEWMEEWLPGRSGSFRGFEIAAGRVSVFVDALASRPVFFVADGERALISDKLATLVVNRPGGSDVDWGGTLEVAILGSLYSRQTTLEGAGFLAPGETVEFDGGEIRRRQRTAPVDPSVDPERVRRDPGGSLLDALRRAVEETWSDRESWLLLSGGLDSRLTLGLAGSGRKALTLDLYPAETKIAAEIARACGAEHLALPLPEGHYRGIVRLAHLVGGGMYEPHLTSHLGLGRLWRAHGVASVAHAFLYDTLLKGWAVFRQRPYAPLRESVLYSLMGDQAECFFRHTLWFVGGYEERLVGMLTPAGTERVRGQLRRLAAAMPEEVEQGLNVSLERLLLGNVSRHIYYGLVLSWLEELDVVSPVYHASPWTWYAASNAADRYHAQAMIQAIFALHHPIGAIVSANTGRGIELPKTRWTERLQKQPLYPAMRYLWRRWKGVADRTPAKVGYAAEFRTEEGRALLEESLAGLEGNQLFDREAILQSLRRFEAGDDAPIEPLLALAGAGRWSRFVKEGRGYSGPGLREIPVSGG